MLVGHDNVLDACVVGLPDERRGEVVAVAFSVEDDASDGLLAEVSEYVGRRLAPFKVPVRWFVIDQMPTTPTGKVRKFEVRDAIVNGQLREL